MRYIKGYNEEIDVKKALLGGALAATMIGTSCKKEDILPNDVQKITVDSTKVDDKVDDVTDDKKSKVYNFADAIDKISGNKKEPVKSSKPKKIRKINKFKDFIKSKFKKG